MRERHLLIGSLAVVTAASGFGLLGVLSRFSYDAGLAPLPFVAWRAGFGFLVVIAVVGWGVRAGRGFVDPRRLPRGDAASLLLAALAAFGLNVAMFFAFDITTVAIVLLAFYTYPALVAAVSVILGLERLDRLGWAALGLALAGMVLVVAGGLVGAGASTSQASAGGDVTMPTIQPLGVALGLGAAVCQTLFVTISRGRFRDVPAEQATAWVLLVTVVACAAASVVSGADLGAALASPRALGLVALTGVIAAGIPSLLFLVGLRLIGGTRAGILMLIEPLVGVTLAAAVLQEALHPIQAVGGAAILAAAWLLQRSMPEVETIEPAAVPVEGAGRA